MNLRVFALAATAALAACNPSTNPTPPKQDQAQKPAAAPAPAPSPYDGLRFTDVAEGANTPFTPPPGLQLASLQTEVELSRLGFSSGVIDGKHTRFDKQALQGFQAAHGLDESGTLDDATKAALAPAAVPPTRLVRIPAGFAAGPFVPDLPRATSKQAGFDQLGYRNLMEALAERFHTTPETLSALNGPNAKIAAGATIRVPNIPDVDPAALGADDRGWNRTLVTLGVPPQQPRVSKIVVSKSKGWLRAYDDGGKLLMQAPATMGSSHDPLPLGTWKVLGVSRNPDYHYNPKLFWDANHAAKAAMLKPGPNGPVGVVWIDLSKDHYGIHGTPEPALIGRSESHGCVRLTNWDAARLAQMVKPGVTVLFQK